MAFALCMSADPQGDLEVMTSHLRDARLNQQDLHKSDQWWDSGLSAWATAPHVPSNHPYAWDPTMLLVVVANGTLDMFRAHLCYLKDNYSWASDCITFADMLADRQFGTEPWPWAPPGENPWAAWPVGT